MIKAKRAHMARDFMHKHVETVCPATPLSEIVKHLLDHGVSNLPVVDNTDGKQVLVGFISEADCMEHLANEIFYGNPAPPLTAGTIMKRHPVCVEPDTNIFTLATVFNSQRLRHLPVVEEHQLLGIVSRRDVLRELERHYREAIECKQEDRNRPDLGQIINHRFIMRNV